MNLLYQKRIILSLVILTKFGKSITNLIYEKCLTSLHNKLFFKQKTTYPTDMWCGFWS